MGRKYTNRMVTKIWSPTTVMEYEGLISEGVEIAFHYIPLDQQAAALEKMQAVHQKMRASAADKERTT